MNGGTPVRIRCWEGGFDAQGGLVGVIDERRQGQCAWARTRVQKRGKRGAGGSVKPMSARGERLRERGGSSGRGHAEREGGRVGVGARWVGVVDRHDTNTVAPGCSDSGGWPERAANRGGDERG
jgi:hypothetical protein